MMSDLETITGEAAMLPGLEPAPATAGPLERAVRRTLAALKEAGYVRERDAARCALAIELAQIITDKRRSGRTSTVGNDARVLVELLDDLLPEDTGVDNALQDAMAEWQSAIAGMTGGAR